MQLSGARPGRAPAAQAQQPVGALSSRLRLPPTSFHHAELGAHRISMPRRHLTVAAAEVGTKTVTRTRTPRKASAGSKSAAPRTRRSASATGLRRSRNATPAGLKLRRGKEADLAFIYVAVAKEWLNPLGLEPERFTVATVPVKKGKPAPPGATELLLGCGQLRPMGYQRFEDNDPDYPPAKPGPREWEMSTLVVAPHVRGRGIGSRIVTALQARVLPGDRISLVTLESSTPFYARLGFSVATNRTQVPRYLSMELLVGGIVADKVAHQRLVVMTWTAPASHRRDDRYGPEPEPESSPSPEPRTLN